MESAWICTSFSSRTSISLAPPNLSARKNAPWKVPVRQEFLVGHVQALQFLNTFVSALDGHVLFRFLFSISNTRVC